MTSLMHKAVPISGDLSNQKPNGFEEHAKVALGALRAAMERLIAAIPGAGQIKRATDLQRALGIRSTLAWQIFKVANAANPLDEGRSVPGATALEKFLDAAAKRGVPQVFIHDVQKAFETFESLVRTYAGNRAAFDSMIGGLTQEGSESLDLMHKRASFRACSHFVGARAKATLASLILHPSAHDPRLLDMVAIKGLVGLSTQRRNASWGLSNIRDAKESGDADSNEGLFPLDPKGALQGIAFFREFCTEPLPRFEVCTQSDGTLSVFVNGELIDQQSVVTLLLGFIMKGIDPNSDGTRILALGAAVQTPSEKLLLDVLIRHDILPISSPGIEVIHDISGQPNTGPHLTHQRLVMRESVLYKGRGPDVLDTDVVPRYRDMICSAMNRVGWNPAGFDLYRCEIEFPVVPSTASIVFELPEVVSNA